MPLILCDARGYAHAFICEIQSLPRVLCHPEELPEVFVIFLNDLWGGTISPFRIQMLTVGTVAAVTLLTLASMHSNGILATVVTP